MLPIDYISYIISARKVVTREEMRRDRQCIKKANGGKKKAGQQRRDNLKKADWNMIRCLQATKPLCKVGGQVEKPLEKWEDVGVVVGERKTRKRNKKIPWFKAGVIEHSVRFQLTLIVKWFPWRTFLNIVLWWVPLKLFIKFSWVRWKGIVIRDPMRIEVTILVIWSGIT